MSHASEMMKQNQTAQPTACMASNMNANTNTECVSHIVNRANNVACTSEQTSLCAFYQSPTQAMQPVCRMQLPLIVITEHTLNSTLQTNSNLVPHNFTPTPKNHRTNKADSIGYTVKWVYWGLELDMDLITHKLDCVSKNGTISNSKYTRFSVLNMHEDACTGGIAY